MPSDLTLKAMNTVHRVILRISGGRLGWEAGNMPVLELTTTGRKSGKLRSVMLTSPIQEGESIVIVASRGGDDVHPAWYLNLVANPQVQVKLKGEPTKTMTARTATADERARLWPIVEQKYKGYAGYQQRTDREIPLIFLD
ncbi:nitroreductase [Actinomycetes bacterium]|jgi:deazaflavin-dependent oxidoreductase (nitroreductase family)|nr:nitroreductase [Actinomycetes bacterium]